MDELKISGGMTIRQPGNKGAGWCEKNGVVHAWENGPTLTSNPPQKNVHCPNCEYRGYRLA